MNKKKKSITDTMENILANENIEEADLTREIEWSYLSYSMYVIIARAIPDVRDGLKPVLRRILYNCIKQGYTHNHAYVKSSKIDGETIANYHPHGSVYGSIANMSQEWVYHYPLIDLHGNNGTVDGDGPAASRYTDSRLASIAETALLEDVTAQKSVDFMPNYSETEMEPKVLPALLPNFLVNGANGIAVGWSTNIPSHNLNEVCDAIIYAIKNPNYTIKDLMKYIKGPDFPFSCSMLSSGIEQLYETGESRLEFRSNYILEDNDENGNPQIVFTDITPDTQKPKVVSKINDMIIAKELPRAIMVRDESSGMNIRIVIECQKNANIPLIIKTVYDKTPLHKFVSYFMRGIYDGLKTITLPMYISIYLEHRRDVLKRRYTAAIEDISKKLNIQYGILAISSDAKRAAMLIAECETDEDAKNALMKKYSLNEQQANYIMDRQIRTLVKKDKTKTQENIDKLEKELAYSKKIITDASSMNDLIIEQLDELKKKYGTKRVTPIVKSFDNEIIEDMDTEVVVCVYSNGNIGIYEKDDYAKYVEKKQYKDKNNLFVMSKTVNRYSDILLIHRNGLVDKINVQKIVGIKYSDVITIVSPDVDKEKTLVSVFKNASVKKTPVEKLKTVLVKDCDIDVVTNILVDDTQDETVVLATHNGNIGRFSVNSFTSTSSGARAMDTCKMDDGDYVVDARVVKESKDNDSKLLIVYNNKNGYGYKVVDMGTITVKGRRAHVLNYVHGKGFVALHKIYYTDSNTFILYDDGNKEFVFEDFVVSNRMVVGNEFDYTLGSWSM